MVNIAKSNNHVQKISKVIYLEGIFKLQSFSTQKTNVTLQPEKSRNSCIILEEFSKSKLLSTFPLSAKERIRLRKMLWALVERRAYAARNHWS